MLNPAIEKELLGHLGKLAVAQQRQVLNYARALAAPVGTPGKELLRFAGTIEPDDLNLMAAAIKQGCEQACKSTTFTPCRV